jgi:release factor glutamine methyltransferase
MPERSASVPPTGAEVPRTAREMLARARDFLARKDVPEARLEAELLVAHALGADRLRLFMALDRPVEQDEIARARELLARRARGEPCAYLLGRREFYGRPFAVGPGVLVPRPETELVVDRARELCAGRQAPRIGELGTGSGCIAITLALELPGARVRAVELSAAALEWARRNARALGADVELEQGDGILALAAHGPYDVLVSNPPYVDPADAGELLRDVREHEPVEALFAPAGDPDHWVRRLLDEGRALLAPGGALLVELSFDQAPRVRALCAERGLVPTLVRDLAGVERVLELVIDPA